MLHILFSRRDDGGALLNKKRIRQQFADTMLEVGQNDPNLVVLLGDISHFILQPFAKACPGRYYNVGICEPTIVSMAAGLAKVGFYPVVHTIAPFIVERSFEQIKLDFCYQQLDGNLVTVFRIPVHQHGQEANVQISMPRWGKSGRMARPRALYEPSLQFYVLQYPFLEGESVQ